ncbi:1-acyl-sn-glycerol-3-phosphate acyltransferase [Haematospirillum jordaniae]|uniref:lysophospholipid acyltransferase family protein n=1 Tax=Haematospirillum jordaniae TaxID=1549855 RepID=UPI0009EE52A3|nr:lysophospholipid acyltransferase family protein [Haematospirillum jordaniae]NKD45072.1 1-acyl-sn-glycerol-3-phosphate acyltransferase [Haematospirillum jordaniae]NKD57109.1 1-acyl-sn-glycerol-3-phosphate acyltransferase [Haematospirillum jordaniae]NKD59342.1 1-acyl-sn-glycerol-3-phosphate acyltransferase [Haematospirillum jordaniae]NKD67035.1 1-acyl-sn-glycerol-3-phosphate acyltransferase [Haematospirillum jordaniae]NKD79378.1 1-acyl-sn-glycerol-3-phosphate acyltransferase [Haematospirillum
MILLVVLRSLVFNIFYVIWTIAIGIVLMPLLLVPGRRSMLAARWWAYGLVFGARFLCGIRWREEGREHLPQGPCIIMSKHQSTWETLYFPMVLGKPVYVLKKELLSVPIVGWHMRKSGMIAIDRKAGATAMKVMLRGVEEALGRESQIILFPEGTRTQTTEYMPFQPGAAALYSRFGKSVPVVPVALNTGMFWARSSFMRYPGEIVVRYLPPVPHGLDRETFNRTIEDAINNTSRTLCGLPLQMESTAGADSTTDPTNLPAS